MSGDAPALSCPALMVAGGSSGDGKTAVTAALARHHRNLGRRVRVFKVGPDFLDPQIHQQASGEPVYQLDLWMGDEAHVQGLLYEAASQVDLILVEGAMGLFDGTPSAAVLAKRFALPVVVVLSAAAMAQTFGALALGLSRYDAELPLWGVVANRIASPTHEAMVAESIPAGVPYLGALPRWSDGGLPSRHLGLVQAEEVADLEGRLQGMAASLAGHALGQLPPSVAFTAPPQAQPWPGWLQGWRVAIAWDRAFRFVYAANVDLLRQMGAEVVWFSPVQDACLPPCDALYLPGGYPELCLAELAGNGAMLAAVRAHCAADKPVLAECGGMLYLLEQLRHHDGCSGALVGALPGRATMQKERVNLGMQQVALPEGVLRAHTFHHSALEMALEPLCQATPQRKTRVGEAVYRLGGVTASYLHLYFPSNPWAAARLLRPSLGP
ncbi:cobyrinate a,c-diamide synthase [Magnetococcus marinus MC-1]|uniref:Cobyrinate a,c-diamide synthase n=1 Tax=Magnetococcus marinus (strain ATCC BAA-1437 / JCM 17883 / MC-1) TaxID=156889 RepID=A0LCD4_MAGMM|nr:cobyrinate a,c-diamide synthase [Magnetococcus marinus]ABK45627.1 cobyrinate a,c-diamide synthase [Magnetococcus marinus MC-1]